MATTPTPQGQTQKQGWKSNLYSSVGGTIVLMLVVAFFMPKQSNLWFFKLGADMKQAGNRYEWVSVPLTNTAWYGVIVPDGKRIVIDIDDKYGLALQCQQNLNPKTIRTAYPWDNIDLGENCRYLQWRLSPDQEPNTDPKKVLKYCFVPN